MSLIAELRLTGDGVTLYRAQQAAPKLRLELERAVVPVDGEPALYLWGTGGDFDAFEAAAPDDPTIREVEVVEEADGRRLFRVVIDPSATTDSATIEQEVGASRLSASSTVEGIDFRMRFPDWPALQRYIDLARDAGVEVRLQAVYAADDGHAREQYGLSTKQHEMLREALDAGYFGVPRNTDLTALAGSFDISEQAASERLRRGLASLLDATVGQVDVDEDVLDLPVRDEGDGSNESATEE